MKPQRERPLPWTWPTGPSKYVGIGDFGTTGGAYRPRPRHRDQEAPPLRFANDEEVEFGVYGQSKVNQMTPRLRRWDPRPAGETNNITESETASSLQYLRATNPDDWFPEETIFDILHQERKDAYNHSVYDPYRGKLCHTGQFLGLPVIASPVGALGNELGINLIQCKEKQHPPYNILPPRCGLVSMVSPILQIAVSSIKDQDEVLVRTRESVAIVGAHPNVPEAISRIEPDYVRRVDQISARPGLCSDLTIHAAFSPYIRHQYALVGDRGRLAIWTRDASSVSTTTLHSFTTSYTTTLNKADTTNSNNNNNANASSTTQHHPSEEDDTLSSVNDYLLREHELDDYIMAMDEVLQNGREPPRGNKRRNIRDMSGGKRARTVTATGAVDGTITPMRSFNIVRDVDSDVQEADDPWHTCSWGAHPCQIILANRHHASLVDFRGKNTEMKLFDVRGKERIVALQEADRTSARPFQRYLATNLQVVCIDQRMPHRPLISWAHHQGAHNEPCGIEVLEMCSNQIDLSTVVTWSERNAYISATTVTLDAHVGAQPYGHSVLGRSQELVSFHEHPYYTHTTAYRETQYQWCDDLDAQGKRMMSLKPALYGLSLMSKDDIVNEDDEDEDEVEEEKDDDEASVVRRRAAAAGVNPEQLARRVQTARKGIRRRHRAVNFSVLQYSATGAIYGQQLKIAPGDTGDTLGYTFASGFTRDDLHQRRVRQLEKHARPGSVNRARVAQMRLERALVLPDRQVAFATSSSSSSFLYSSTARKKNNRRHVYEEQRQQQHMAEEEEVTAKEVRDHVLLDMSSMVDFFKSYLEMDRESDPRTAQLVDDTQGGDGLQTKMEEMIHMLQDKTTPNMTVFELIREIRCLDLPLRHREALQQGIEDYLRNVPARQTINESEGEGEGEGSNDGSSTSPSSSSSRSAFQKTVPTWNAKAMNIRVNPSLASVSASQIEQELERQYPLPATVPLVLSDETDLSLARSMANMHVRSSASDGGGGQDTSTTAGGRRRRLSSVVEWPSQEVRGIRHRTLERLAQDLKLSSTLIIKGSRGSSLHVNKQDGVAQQNELPRLQTGSEQEIIPTSASDAPTVADPTVKVPVDMNFQYLFQSGNSARRPPVVKVAYRVQPIWQEWIVGTDPSTYQYVPPGKDAAEEDSDEERERREAEEREEKLLRLRMRREKRQARTREVRSRDLFHNSTGGSLSQPAGLETSSSSWTMEDDDDFVFSALPKVVSTSQPAALRAKATATLTQNSGTTAPPPPPLSSLKKTVSFTSPPDKSNDWIGGGSATLPTVTSSSLDAFLDAPDISASQEEFDTGAEPFSASQPVPGAFGSRPPPISAAKKKKKKPRTQGF